MGLDIGVRIGLLFSILGLLLTPGHFAGAQP